MTNLTDEERGDPRATTRKELLDAFKLVDVSNEDVFCDLGCGHGKICVWASKEVKFCFGVEEKTPFFNESKRNVRKSKKTNIKLLKEDYTDAKTLRKLKNCTVFYCTNGETWGFYKRFENLMNKDTWFISLYFPPYPIKVDRHRGWMFAMKTPFKIARNRNEWLRSITKSRSIKSMKIKIRADYKDYKDRIKELDDWIEGFDWIKKKLL